MEFYKLQANGNNFIITISNDVLNQDIEKMCDYKYGIGDKIMADGSWIFPKKNMDELDILDRFIIKETENTIKTKGSSAIMYAFNALEDLRLKMPQIWEQIKIKYWG